MTLSIGFKTAPQMTTYAEILRVWEEADTVPSLEHAWLFDHFAPIGGYPLDGPCLEGWTLLAALAARTERLRVGLMVTGNTYRNPAILAQIGATADIISQGRLDFGIGAAWNEIEHTMYDVPFYTPAERIRRMGEACVVIKSLWTNETTNFDGRYYHLREARCEPKPVQKPYPPFTIGGGGEQLTLKIVARHADVWNFVGGDVEMFKHKMAVLDEHCRAEGRDPARIQRSIQPVVIYDDAPKTIAAILPYIDAGANHIVLNLRPPYPQNIAHWLADEIIPALQPA